MSIVKDRVAGMGYTEIAKKHGVSPALARHRCRRAMKRGDVTAEQIGFRPHKKKRPHRAAYEGLYEKLVARIRKDENGCWLWTGPFWKNRPWPQNRYGYVMVWDGERYKSIGTHRAMLIAIHGPLAPEQCACHRCDVPLCINPEHLFIGSMRDNIHDSRSKNRHHEAKKDRCDRGHPLSGDNLIMRRQQPPKLGIRRVCRICEYGRHRLRAGWPEHLAFDMSFKVPSGFMLDRNTWQLVQIDLASARKRKASSAGDQHE